MGFWLTCEEEGTGGDVAPQDSLDQRLVAQDELLPAIPKPVELPSEPAGEAGPVVVVGLAAGENHLEPGPPRAMLPDEGLAVEDGGRALDFVFNVFAHYLTIVAVAFGPAFDLAAEHFAERLSELLLSHQMWV